MDAGQAVLAVAYTCFLVFSLLGHIPVLGGYLKLIQNGALALLVLGFILKLKDFRGEEIVSLASFGVLFLVVAVCSNDYSLVKLVLLLAVVKGTDFKWLVRFDIRLRCLLIVTVAVLSLFGIAPDEVSFYQGIERHSLGFTNPNTFGLACVILCMELLYLNEMTMRLKTGFVVLGIAGVVNWVAGSRTAVAIILLALIICIIRTYHAQVFQRRVFCRFVQLLPAIFLLVTFAGTYFYSVGSPLAHALDTFLSGRLANVQYHASITNLTLFGSDLSNNDRTLDSFYAYSIYGLGIISSAIIIICFSKIAKVLQQKDPALLYVLFCLLVYGLSERLWFAVDYNALMLMFMFLFPTGDFRRSNQLFSGRAASND